MIDYDKFRDIMREKLEYWQNDVTDADIMDISYNLKEFIAEETSFKLYRYIPINYFNIRNLETQKIHLSPNGVLNDVYEGLPYFGENVSYSQLQQIKDLAYMVCMTESNNNTLMWSHYADNHAGICIEYDLKQLEEGPYDLVSHLFPVVYEDHRKIYRNLYTLIESHKELKKAIEEETEYDGYECLDNILPLFITKGSNWSYEREWRILFSKKQMYDINESGLYDGNLYFRCITSVYLGYRIHPEVKKNIEEICKRISTNRKPVSLYQAKLAGNTYTIDFEKIKL